MQAGPSKEDVPKATKFAPEPSPLLGRFERLSRDLVRPLSSASASSRERTRERRRKSIDGQEFSYETIGHPREPQSPTSAYHAAERLKNRKLYSYVKTWRSNFILTLDGGGVRGYSQLIILKALMDKVATIEKSRRDDEGRIVESSFHPFSWEEDKSIKLQKRVVRRRTTTRKKSESSHTVKGKQVEKSSDTSSEEEAGAKFYPYHYFDWVAGTSTGGLNAIMLGRLRMSVDDCLKDYGELAEKIFGKPRWFSYRLSPFFWFCAKYSGTRLKDAVNQLVENHLCDGEGQCFAMNKEMCRTVVVAMKKNVHSHEMAHLFRTYDHHRRRQAPVVNQEDRKPNPMEKVGPADTSLIWQVARATSAAPTYFNTMKIGDDEFGDGGFGKNNPSTLLFWEVSQMNHNIDAANSMSISIGTGISRFSRFQNGLFKRPIGWLHAAKKVSTDCEESHAEMQNITAFGRKYEYYRFNVPEKATDPDAEPQSRWQHLKSSSKKWFGHGGEPLDRGLGKIKLDEWKSKGFWRKESTQEEIRRVTEEYLDDPTVDLQLNAVALRLVNQRRARAKTPRWATYALGIRYECPLVNERCPDDTWTEPSELRRHLIEDHEYNFGSPDLEVKLEEAIRAGMCFEHHH